MTEMKEFIQSQLSSPAFDLQKQYANYKGILKNAQEGKVVTRFPPQPSGYLHIGHCKAALLNFHYAKMYKGNMILRFDDTNPTKEKNEFVEAIIQDLQTLGIQHSRLTYTSDYFPLTFDLLRGLLQKNLAYVDNTPVEQMRKERQEKINSACRELSVEKNLEIFELMLKGKADQYCVRAKIGMENLNGCMRDPVLARVNHTPHHRTGKKYCVYPTYDFACPIVDSVEGVTHVLRTNQYADRIPQYMWVLKALDFKPMEIYQYSRLNLQYTVLSKRKLTEFVDQHKVEGWSDPRFPTLRGCLRKGIRVETLIQFMLEQGPSKRANLMEWQKIWAINKRIIDPICPRLSAVSVEKASLLRIVNVPLEAQAVSCEQSKLNKALGLRPVWRGPNVLIEFNDAHTIFEVGKKVTLMNWGNVMILSKELQENGSYKMQGEYLFEDTDFKTTHKVTWLADIPYLIVANLIQYDHLIKTPKVDENALFEDLVNVNSKFITKAYVDGFLRTFNHNQFMQLERRGYYRVDSKEEKENQYEYSLILIPDGKKVGIASIATTTDKQGDIKKKDLAEKVQDKKNKGKKKNQQKEEKQEDKDQKEGENQKKEKGKKEKKQKKEKKEKEEKEVVQEKTQNAAKIPQEAVAKQ